ncbi:hypothetical protein CF327_g4738 [Tilletia walkeri]|nr:hypothetical protein CF327_g4738 [Tilletia walkeri]
MELRYAILDTVGRAVRARFPGATVHWFGSSATAMELSSADLDINIMLPFLRPTQEASQHHLKQLARALEPVAQGKFVNKNWWAKLPVLNFTTLEEPGSLPIDVAANRQDACDGKRLAQQLLAADARLRPAVLLLKHILKGLGT